MSGLYKRTDIEATIVSLALKGYFSAIKELGINQNHFSVPNLRSFWIRCGELIDRGAPTDLLTMSAVIEHQQILELEPLYSMHPSGKLDFYTKTLQAHYHDDERECMLASISQQLKVTPRDIHEIKQTTTEFLDSFDLDASSGITGKWLNEAHDITAHSLETQIAKSKQGIPIGISSGIEILDDILYGWQKKKLYIMAARPGMGKTTLAVNFIKTAAELGKGVAFFSGEMGVEEMDKKLLSLVAKVNSRGLLTGDLTDVEIEKVESAIKKTREYSVMFDDRKLKDFDALQVDIRTLVRSYAIDLVMLDYVQLMSIDGFKGDRVRELTKISMDLKALAMELDIPIIAIAQINREADKQLGVPSLHHLKDCGSFEQDADAVIVIHRESMNPDITDPKDWLAVRKNRNGITGKFQIGCDLKYNSFWCKL